MFKKLMSKIKSFYLYLQKVKNENPEKGAAFLAPFIPVLIGLGSAVAGWYAVKSSVTGAALEILAGGLVLVGDLFLYISGFLCKTAGEVFDASLVWLSTPITHNTTFISGWGAIRDFSNMFIVLGFVVVGIATALRLREYEAKKLLMPLIVVALLINFSGLFCGLVIDASSIMTKSLITAGGISTTPGGGMGMQYYQMIKQSSDKLLETTTPANDRDTNLKFLSATIEISFMFLIVAATFVYMGIIFIIRYAMLAFLFILSPLAFVCKVFPISAAQKIWNDWWQNFLKWAFIGVGGSFALWIASTMMQSLVTAHANKLEVTEMIVVLIFLVIGFKITTRQSAGVASAVMGVATGAAGFAAGAIVGGAKLTGVAGLAQRGSQKAQSLATQAGERLNLIAPGTDKLRRQTQLKEHKSEERATTWTAEQRKNLATGRDGTTRQRNDKVEAIKQMAEKGELGSLSLAQREVAVTYAQNHGTPASVLAKKDYRASEYDTGPTGRATVLGSGFAARAEALQNNLSGMSQEQLHKVDHRDINEEFIMGHAMTGNIIKKYRTADLARIIAIKAAARTGRLATELAAATAAGDVNEIRRLTNIQNEAARL